MQTISWLPDYCQFLVLLSKTQPEWILITSLFYRGPVDAEIKIKDYSRTMGDKNYRDSYYNIYSVDKFHDNLKERGYSIVEIRPFDLGFDIDKPKDGSMSTYTEKTIDGRRLQVSGPLLMSWYTILVRKTH